MKEPNFKKVVWPVNRNVDSTSDTKARKTMCNNENMAHVLQLGFDSNLCIILNQKEFKTFVGTSSITQGFFLQLA